ncbi:Ubiquitin receptor RAD23b [Aduncisulcus paluster]|uniref:Ubiquitin receptor RAD23b n=1 Tax=Aduncisulcus paluster TaxID=2918883 RepID=A0ABQ5K6K9_9EUKA|nr:Ubiquitin receptor RAD23b [Aduncisulcus paluster]|eukprot:gnl/Carplike_NY0171/832_a1146_1880.p1 GENE.gnl/Carplike_NY0171/832_a1146_1880~~gnl/Carplike_NY0171/832_a1146_1880.p1  ORF type:complete len:409 (-),score=163.93 gnl/Carplike_NY0171/832_a1146_1880:57-1208(-)
MDIKKRKFEVDHVESDWTIDRLKQAFLEQNPGLFVESSVQICHKGAILANEKTVTEHGLTEAAPLIVFGRAKKVKKPAPKEPEPKETTIPATPAVTTTQPIDTPAAPQAQPPATTPETGSTTPVATGQRDSPSTPEVADPPGMDTLLSMGFSDKDKNRRALRAARGDISLASQFLCEDHIPEVPAAPMGGMEAPMGGSESTGSDGGASMGGLGGLAGAGGAGGMAGSLQALAALQRLASNPEAIQQLAASTGNAQFIALARENPDLVLRLLAQQVLGGGMGGMGAPMGGMGGAGMGAGMGGAPRAPPPGSVTITREEKEQIENVAAITGVPFRVAASIFVQTGRNPDVAASFILEHKDELVAEDADDSADTGSPAGGSGDGRE